MGREEKGENEWERGMGRERKEEFIPQCSLAVDATDQEPRLHTVI